MHLLLAAELLAALRDDDVATFKPWIAGGVEDLGLDAVCELLAEWLPPMLTQGQNDRLIAWQLDVRL